MYLIEAFFSLQTDQFSLEKQSHCVNQIIEQWRYNGQIIGREIPQFVAEQENQTGLAVRVTCPEQTSLLAEFNNSSVDEAIQAKSAVYFLRVFRLWQKISIQKLQRQNRRLGKCSTPPICNLARRYKAVILYSRFHCINN